MSAVSSEKREIRNQIVLSRLYGIDISYSEFEAQLTRERQAGSFATSTTILALTTAATAVGATETKTALSAIAAVLAGGREQFDKEVLLDRTVSLLQTQMQAERKRVKSRIVQNLELNTQIYPLELALSDLESYYRAGTITGALVGVSEDAGVRLREATVLEEQVISAQFGATNLSDKLRAFFRASERHRAAMTCWLQGTGLRASLVINSPDYSELQRRMYEELVVASGYSTHPCRKFIVRPATSGASRTRVLSEPFESNDATRRNRSASRAVADASGRRGSDSVLSSPRTDSPADASRSCVAQPDSKSASDLRARLEHADEESTKKFEAELSVRRIPRGRLLNCLEYEAARREMIEFLKKM
ncbi:hypothetical protein [Methylorubrum extorquens]|uniref:hypothetical protein n=1 Tax=Methylorubrum extorquens TaxID=408 RepID=UPI001EE5A2C6|nr:hypothetical protein [Methylorubrum extorquens]MCG5249061.1 hypothetical protein [Methylorubrum extorquens]